MSKIIEEPESGKQSVNSRKTIITIKKIAEILDDIISEHADNSVSSDEDNHITDAFTSKKLPHISIFNYLKRIIRYVRPEYSSMLLALIYIDKLIEEKDFLLNIMNIHRLLLAAIVVAIKYNEDEFYSNTFYARVGGISLNELNKLEYVLLDYMEFELYIEEEIFIKYDNCLGDDEPSEEMGEENSNLENI